MAGFLLSYQVCKIRAATDSASRHGIIISVPGMPLWHRKPTQQLKQEAHDQRPPGKASWHAAQE
jgi:hypothetical protein